MGIAPAAYRVAISAVISDLPDENGVALVGDVAGGWAFRVSDGQGVARHRAAGSCAGGRDDAMRCALLSALVHVPRRAPVHLALDTSEDVRLLSQLIRRDPGVRRALSGRMRSAELCPADRDVWQARFAAERMAKLQLGSRTPDGAGKPHGEARADDATWLRRTLPAAPSRARPPSPAPAGEEHHGTRDGWLSRRLRMLRPVAPAGGDGSSGEPERQAASPAAGDQTTAGREGTIEAWLQELDASIASMRGGLRGPREAEG